MSTSEAVENSAEEPRRSKLTPMLWLVALAMMILGAVFALRARTTALALTPGTPGLPISPTDLVIPAEARTFVWNSAPGSARYVLELVLADSVVFLDTLGDTSTTLPAGLVLGEGDYIWSIRVLWADSASAAFFRWFRVSTP